MPRPPSILAVLALATAACAHTSTSPTLAKATYRVQTAIVSGLVASSFGTVGDGVADDRPALQAALDAAGGSTLHIPSGTYRLTQAPGKYWCLKVPPGTKLVGDGDRPALVEDVLPAALAIKLIEADGAGIEFSNLELRGNRATRGPDEHQHGINADACAGLRITDVWAHGFSGDGFYLYNGCDNAQLTRVRSTDNGRNGMTLGGTMTGVRIADSEFFGSDAQQIDSEAPSGYQNAVIVEGNTLSPGASGQFVLTISGSSTAVPSVGWIVRRNVLNGGVLAVWAKDTLIEDNTGANSTTLPSVRIYRASSGVEVRGNRFTASNAAGGIVHIAGTAGNTPVGTIVDGNTLTATGVGRAVGIKVEGAGTVELTNNAIRGNGLLGTDVLSTGIGLRATNPDVEFVSGVIRGNRISNWGAYGVSITCNGLAVLRTVDISNNIFADTSGTMTWAMNLDDGTGCARVVTQQNNLILGGVAAMIRTQATGVHAPGPTGDRWTKP